MVFAAGEGESTQAAEKPVITILARMSNAQSRYDLWSNESEVVTEMNRLYDKATIEWEFFEHQGGNEILTLRFASGDLPDVVQLTSIRDNVAPTAVDNGIFVPLNDLLDTYAPHISAGVTDYQWENPKLSEPDGTIYGIPRMQAAEIMFSVFARKDWLNKLGLDDPETIEDYLEYFQLIKENDMDGDGDTTDEVPFGVRAGLGYSELFFAYFGVHPNAWQVIDGEMIPNIVNPDMKDAVAFWRDLYSKGYVNQDMFTRTGGDWVAQIRGDEIGMWCHDVQNLNTSWNLNTFNNPDADLVNLRAPRRADGTVPLATRGTGTGHIYTIIADSAESPEAVVEFFDWHWSNDAAMKRFFRFGVEGINHTIDANGNVQYDSSAPVNGPDGNMGLMRATFALNKDLRLEEDVIKIDQGNMAEYILKGKPIAAEGAFDNPALYMPKLKASLKRPELGYRGGGTLFMDMFAKVVSGKEDIDATWDAYVADWYDRGGEDVIKEATAWYNQSNK